MERGYSAAMAARGTDRRRIRDGVDGGDKEKETDQANYIL